MASVGRQLRYHKFQMMLLLVVLIVIVTACGAETLPEEQHSVAVLKRGEELYNANCLSCHGGATGGQMRDIPPPHNANGHTWHHPDCQLVAVVLDGSGEMGQMMRRMMGADKRTPRMPAFRGTLSEENVRDILAYIKTWWTEEQRRAQARKTTALCR